MTTDIATKDTYLEFEHLSPLICMELAAGLSDPAGVREKYCISKDQWTRLKNTPTFVAMMKEATATFSGDMNAGKRIVKKAEILLEESLPVLHNLLTSPDSSSSTITDVVKQLAVLAGKTGNHRSEGGAVGAGFNVEIQIHSHDSGKGVIIQGN
jgi:hypothetical protein